MNLVTDSPQLRANDLVVAKDAAEALHAHYKGHLWAVSCDNGVLRIRNMALSGNWGVTLYSEQAHSASELKLWVMRAGGEILEHFRMIRGRMDWDRYSELPTDFAGRHKADL